MNKHVNGCRLVNGGIVEEINGMEVEILSHNFHNPYCNIVCHYFMDNGQKVEVTYWKDISIVGDKEGHEVYFFKSREELGHHYSRSYHVDKLPHKYKEIGAKLKAIHSKIDFNKYEDREVK